MRFIGQLPLLTFINQVAQNVRWFCNATRGTCQCCCCQKYLFPVYCRAFAPNERFWHSHHVKRIAVYHAVLLPHHVTNARDLPATGLSSWFYERGRIRPRTKQKNRLKTLEDPLKGQSFKSKDPYRLPDAGEELPICVRRSII